MSAERVAAEEAARGEEGSDDGAVFSERFFGVSGAGGLKAAGGRKERREGVAPHEDRDEACIQRDFARAACQWPEQTDRKTDSRVCVLFHFVFLFWKRRATSASPRLSSLVSSFQGALRVLSVAMIT